MLRLFSCILRRVLLYRTSRSARRFVETINRISPALARVEGSETDSTKFEEYNHSDPDYMDPLQVLLDELCKLDYGGTLYLTCTRRIVPDTKPMATLDNSSCRVGRCQKPKVDRPHTAPTISPRLLRHRANLGSSLPQPASHAHETAGLLLGHPHNHERGAS